MVEATMMTELTEEANKALTSHVICPMRWFLVKVNRNGYLDGNNQYFIIHITDLMGLDAWNVVPNSLVKFISENEIADGIVLQTESHIFNLVQKIKDLTSDDPYIYESTHKLLQRLTHSLRQVYRCVGSFMHAQYKLPMSIADRRCFLNQLKQLSLDADDLLAVKGFFNSLDQICTDSWAIIENNKTLTNEELKLQLNYYMETAMQVAGDVINIQRTFHPPNCICNVYNTPQIDAILQDCDIYDEELENLDR